MVFMSFLDGNGRLPLHSALLRLICWLGVGLMHISLPLLSIPFAPSLAGLGNFRGIGRTQLVGIL